MNGWIISKAKNAKELYGLRRLIEAFNNEEVPINIISWADVDILLTSEKKRSILIEGKLVDFPDFILPRATVSLTYYGLAFLRHMERLNIPVINSSSSIEIAKDKLYSLQILAQAGLPVPDTMLMKYPVNIDYVKKHFKFPLVVKTLIGSQGKGVHLVQDQSSLEDFMDVINAINSNFNILIQEFISSSRGKDLRIFIVGGKIIAGMLRKTDNGFKANISKGAIGEPYELTDEIKWLASEAVKVLGLDIAGVDLLFDKDSFKICEVNCSPGFEGLEKYCNIDVAQEIVNYVKLKCSGFQHENG